MDRRRWLKVISVLMCVVLVTGIVINQSGFLKNTTANADVWSGVFPAANKNTKYGGGSGTKASPYNIASAEQLAQMVSNVNAGFDVNKSFQLTVDINLNNGNWRAIGTENDPFEGVFNGNGHSIDGLYISTGTGSHYGLFGYLENATVQNLKLTGSIDVGAGRDVGAVAGRCVNATVQDCRFTGSVTGGSYVGGIVGTLSGSNALINGCTVGSNSMITAGSMAAGGIVGMMNAGTTVLNCSNYAGVKLTSETSTGETSSAAGLAGYVNDASIANSFNSGNVSSTFYASGLLAGKTAVVTNCYNIGSVMANSSGRAGSISALLDNSTTLNGVYFLNGTAEGYPGVLDCFCTNVGVMTAPNPDLEKYSNGSVTWTVSGMNIQEAIDDGVSALLTEYPGLIREWEVDGSNNYYPVLTSNIGHEHDWNGKKETIKAATCTTSGMEKVYCTKCEKSTTRPIDALGHNYKETHKVLPTCTGTGIDVEVCTRCDDEQNEKVVNALGHRPKNTKVAPTCTEAGYNVTACAVCAYEFDRVDYEALGHDWDEENFETRQANCFSPELHYVKCKVCKTVRTDTIPGTQREHQWDAVSGVAVASTCIKKGGMVRTCQYSDCKYQEWLGEREPLAAHVFEFKDKIEPTCEKAGYTLDECSVCHEVTQERDVQPALGHNYGVLRVVEPTCKEAGYTVYRCLNSGCKSEYNGKKTETLQHDWKVASETQPSCMVSGEQKLKCSLCGKDDTKILPAYGSHDFVTSEALSAEPTCTEDGQVVHVCKRDSSHTKVAKVLDKLGHEWEDTVVPPTCLLGGYTLHKCVRGDDETHINPTEPLGHKMVTTVVEPTITSMGYTLKACSNTGCEESSKSQFIAATPNAHFDYKELALVLSDMEEPMKYSLDGGKTWVSTEAVSVSFTEDEMDDLLSNPVTAAAMKIQEVDASGTSVEVKTGAIIKVVRPGNQASEERPIADSYVQDVKVLVAKEPALLKDIKPSAENAKGAITGVDETMEYRSEKDTEWTPVTGNVIENLEPGIYYVRVKATESSLASEEMQVIIEAYVAPTAKPAESPAPSSQPGTSAAPGTSATPGQSSKPGTSAAPGQSSQPGASTAPGQSSKPGTATVPGQGGSQTTTDNGQNSQTNPGESGKPVADKNDNGKNNDETSGTNKDGGVGENPIYYSSRKGSAAKTGDETNLVGWILAAGCAAAVAAVLVVKRRKTEE